jgi:hypothetical protein
LRLFTFGSRPVCALGTVDDATSPTRTERRPSGTSTFGAEQGARIRQSISRCGCRYARRRAMHRGQGCHGVVSTSLNWRCLRCSSGDRAPRKAPRRSPAPVGDRRSCLDDRIWAKPARRSWTRWRLTVDPLTPSGEFAVVLRAGCRVEEQRHDPHPGHGVALDRSTEPRCWPVPETPRRSASTSSAGGLLSPGRSPRFPIRGHRMTMAHNVFTSRPKTSGPHPGPSTRQFGVDRFSTSGRRRPRRRSRCRYPPQPLPGPVRIRWAPGAP